MTDKLLFKCLYNGRSPGRGGAKQSVWDLPTTFYNYQKQEQEWISGKWKTAKGEIIPCHNGLHITTNPSKWMSKCNQVWVCEADGIVKKSDDDKYACQRVRLLRPATYEELAKFSIYNTDEKNVMLKNLKRNVYILGKGKAMVTNCKSVYLLDKCDLVDVGSHLTRSKANNRIYDSIFNKVVTF